MAKMKHFSGAIELSRITSMRNAEFAAAFPGVKGRRCDSYSMWVGEPPRFRFRVRQGVRVDPPLSARRAGDQFQVQSFSARM